jgi:arginase
VSETFRKHGILVLSAPSNLGLKPTAIGGEPGVRELPAALLERELLLLLCATDGGVLTPPPYNPVLDALTDIRNAGAIRRYTIELADRVGNLLDQSCFPLVLGGDCSILLGSALALRRRGRFGLLFIDGHTDLQTPATSETGGVAGMDLAIVTGTGPAELTSIEDLSPYVQPEDVVVFGFRWPMEGDESSERPPAPMLALPLNTLRNQGVHEMAKRAVAHFAGRKFWVHLDADVLDPRWMPAVDSPDPDGMTPDELVTVLRIVLSAKNCAGLELTIYDPTLDDSGEGASLLVNVLREGFCPSETLEPSASEDLGAK